MNNKMMIFGLLISCLWIQQGFCMELPEMEFPEEEWGIVETLGPDDLVTLMKEQKPEESYAARLPNELKEELKKFYEFNENFPGEFESLMDQYEKLIYQGRIHDIQKLYLPSYEAFDKLIERTKGFGTPKKKLLTPSDIIPSFMPSTRLPLTLSSSINTDLNVSLLDVLLARKKFEILKLFLKKRALGEKYESGGELYKELYRYINRVPINEVYPYIDVVQALIEYAPFYERDIAKQVYSFLLEKPGVAEAVEQGRMKMEMEQWKMLSEEGLTPEEMLAEPAIENPSTGWLKWFRK